MIVDVVFPYVVFCVCVIIMYIVWHMFAYAYWCMFVCVLLRESVVVVCMCCVGLCVYVCECRQF